MTGHPSPSRIVRPIAGPWSRFLSRRPACTCLALLLAGCDAGPADPPATVYFELDAPLCSSMLPVRFSIDGVEVEVDTFRIHLPPDHVRSRGFALAAGDHLLGAGIPNGLTWPDTLVHLAAGASFTRWLPFYCS